jgi:hypothetical protein
MAKYKIPRDRVFKDFGIMKTISGTYICPGWIPVDEGTTRNDVEISDDIIIEKPINSTQLKPETQRDLEFVVPSSNGKSEYLVKFQRGVWNCNCPASSFRRGDCKHIKALSIENQSFENK